MHKLHTDFWTGNSRANIDVLTGEEISSGKDYIKLAATKRAIGNFVSIVTGKSFPVIYNSGNDSYTDGRSVVISSKVDDGNFDSTVGLALHEGSHCALTDFTLLERVKSDCIDACTDGINWQEQFHEIKDILNYVEDRRIDFFIYSTAPGYKAYYKAMYKKYFEANIITKALKSDDKREVTRENYMFRIINLTNTATDLDALPGLREIWEVLDLRNISRLKSSNDAYRVAKLIDAIITRELDKVAVEEEQDDTSGGEEANGSDESQDGEQGNSPTGNSEDAGTGADTDSDGDLNDDGTTAEGDEAKESTGSKELNELTDKQTRQLERAIEKQNDFMDGSINKTKLSKKDHSRVNAISEADVRLNNVGKDVYPGFSNSRYNAKGVDCVVIGNVTESLIESGTYSSLFYACGVKRYRECVDNGTVLGTMLGRKLQVRNEDTTLKTTRLRNGKIDKRLISSLGYGAEAVFSRLDVDTCKPVLLHLSIDASGSMSGEEWEQAQTAAVAIAKAASMVSNMDVVISYRSTDSVSGQFTPVIAIAYDSRKDKFNKISRILPHIACTGTTPEGLCFESIMDEILKVGNDTDTYFINFSDGMPGFSNSTYYYSGRPAVEHTKRQVDKMKSAGIKVLGYYISRYTNGLGADSLINFKKMYGKDAEQIDPTHITSLAKTLNKRFATK